jgi:hypothetical protein
MEPLKPNSTKVATKWALIYLVTAIIITYIIQYVSSDPNSPLKYIGYLPFIVFLILTQKEFKDQNEGYLTFGEGFSAGFRFAVFASLFIAVFTAIYLSVLNPDIMAKAAEQARAQMEAKNNMSSENIDKAVNITKKIGPFIGAFFIAIIDTIIGIIIALIGAAIFKNERSAYNTPDAADTYTDPTV